MRPEYFSFDPVYLRSEPALDVSMFSLLSPGALLIGSDFLAPTLSRLPRRFRLHVAVRRPCQLVYFMCTDILIGDKNTWKNYTLHRKE